MILIWDIRGINSPLKQSEMIALISKFNLKLVGIVESRVNDSQFNKVWDNISKKLMNWGIINNYSCSSMGRIFILYDKENIRMNEIIIHKQVIHVKMMVDNKEMMCSVIYGSYIVSDRTELWENLKLLGENMDRSWIVAGDFNAVMYDHNRLGGNEIDYQAAEEFKEGIRNANLLELKRIGNEFTWCNNQTGEERIWRKLDWDFVNDRWMDEWPDSYLNVLSPGVSDHSPLLIKMKANTHIRKTPFRFFNIWSDDPAFISLVDVGWSRRSNGSNMFQIAQKLKWLKADLRALNKKKYSDISKRFISVKEIISKLQVDMLLDPFNSILHDEEKACSKVLLKFMAWEESIMRQKSRMNWIRLGDQTTSSFIGVLNRDNPSLRLSI
ncbi:uncharacterized protein LOC126657054 [Mercurialis annua]|uniref:uncharacterized protein LOC126657054 n=1 Tax=Mercurialis annua TaxID=3986 RepID=UPI002160B048|nr:uncharacterized protein LOC126657054 [Mercurialis annua]